MCSTAERTQTNPLPPLATIQSHELITRPFYTKPKALPSSVYPPTSRLGAFLPLPQRATHTTHAHAHDNATRTRAHLAHCPGPGFKEGERRRRLPQVRARERDEALHARQVRNHRRLQQRSPRHKPCSVQSEGMKGSRGGGQRAQNDTLVLCNALGSGEEGCPGSQSRDDVTNARLLFCAAAAAAADPN